MRGGTGFAILNTAFVFCFLLWVKEKKRFIRFGVGWVLFLSGKKEEWEKRRRREGPGSIAIFNKMCSFAHGLFYGLPSPSSARVKGNRKLLLEFLFEIPWSRQIKKSLPFLVDVQYLAVPLDDVECDVICFSCFFLML